MKVLAILRSVWMPYVVAVALAVISVYSRSLLNPLLGREAPLILSVIAVAGAARYGGLGPGLMTTGVSAVWGTILFLQYWGPAMTFNSAHAMRTGVFLLTGFIISALTGEVSRTRGQWRRAEEAVEQAQATAVLQERNRLAREIHDTLAQGFTGIVIQLEAAEDTLTDAPHEAQAHIARARTLARESLAEARRSVQALRPHLLEQRDLAFALRHYVEQMTAGTPVLAEVTVEGTPPSTRLPVEIESQLLRIGLEALTNALKHAEARHIYVILAFRADEVCLSIQDDGRGFSADSSKVTTSQESGTGFGIAVMRERADRLGGALRVTSRPGKGSEVVVTVPIVSAPRSEVTVPHTDLQKELSC